MCVSFVSEPEIPLVRQSPACPVESFSGLELFGDSFPTLWSSPLVRRSLHGSFHTPNPLGESVRPAGALQSRQPGEEKQFYSPLQHAATCFGPSSRMVWFIIAAGWNASRLGVIEWSGWLGDKNTHRTKVGKSEAKRRLDNRTRVK